MTAGMVKDAYLWACLSELEALKVGNVHIYQSGHDMQLTDFVTSAVITAPIISNPRTSVGEKISQSIEASFQAVGCNTNLGIILLVAPIAQACLTNHDQLRDRLKDIIANLDQKDAEHAFQAIARAYAQHLPVMPSHDVRTKPTITLRQAMQQAQSRDLIARQYAHAFDDVYRIGVANLQLNSQNPLETQIALMYLRFLAALPDSHIERQHGRQKALEIQKKAQNSIKKIMIKGFAPCKKDLHQWDKCLKNNHINPGSCADLTVASLMIFFIENLQNRSKYV